MPEPSRESQRGPRPGPDGSTRGPGPDAPDDRTAPGLDGFPDRERRWEAIESKLHAAESWLRDQGTLVRKTVDGRPCWVVRYVVRDRDKRRHRSIYVTRNDPEILRRARVVLARYRQQGDELRQLARWITLGLRSARAKRRP